MTAEQIAGALRGRKSGAGWIACCPAHPDKTPSLSLSDRDGKILVRCHAGCSQTDVVNALKARGLWPESERREWTPDQRHVWAARRRRAEALADEAEAWRAGLVDRLEVEKAAAYEAGRFEYLFALAPELERMRTMHGAALAEAFLAARAERPEKTAALIAARRRDEHLAWNLCAALVRRQ
jgi:hypothetical protein